MSDRTQEHAASLGQSLEWVVWRFVRAVDAGHFDHADRWAAFAFGLQAALELNEARVADE